MEYSGWTQNPPLVIWYRLCQAHLSSASYPDASYQAFFPKSPGSVTASRISWLPTIVSMSAALLPESEQPEHPGYGKTAYLICVDP